MPIDCQRSTSGGKGNFGKFIERDPCICAVGIPSAQPHNTIRETLQCYLLKDEVDALVGNALVPPPEPRPLPPLRHPLPPDTRHCNYTEASQLINPLTQTKFQALVEDLKSTVYTRYWKQPVGCLPDPVPMMPEGFDICGTTYGKKTPHHGRLYDIVMPKEPSSEKILRPRQYDDFGVKTDRKYCSPPFNKELTHGCRSSVEKEGKYMRCCLNDDRVATGKTYQTTMSIIQSNFKQANQPRRGAVLAPNDNARCVSEGYSFGKQKSLANLPDPDNVPKCLITCEMNPASDKFKKCFAALNILRRYLKNRFLQTFFDIFYLNLKFFDKDKTGWLPKDVVYKFCASQLIRFDSTLIEPLLSMWSAFDGSNIEYKIFTHVLNYRYPSPEIAKVPDIPDDCLNFETTYTGMVNSNSKPNLSRMAGLPSGRYFDLDYPITPELCCKADRTCLPQESDMKSCLNPSKLTLLHLDHRDMYAVREPNVVRRVFEAAHGKFTDEQFNTYWEAAKKHHSKGWVCYQTFKRAFENIIYPNSIESEKKKGLY